MRLRRTSLARRFAGPLAGLAGIGLMLPGLATLAEDGLSGRSALPGHAATPSDGITAQLDTIAGLALFEKTWVSSPASTLVSDGLGPLYNARSCVACHPGGGAAARSGPGEASVGLVVQLSVPGPEGAPDPTYGRQLQTRGIAGHAAEAEIRLDWSEQEVALSGGETQRLRAPRLALSDFAYGAPESGLMTSARLAPRLQGLGQVEALSDAAILAEADPEDRDGNGISGRANRDASGRLGRFGWKAAQPDLRHQAAQAFADDIGLSSTLRPGGWGDCTEGQAACRTAPDGTGTDGVEVTDQMLDLVAGYLRGLSPPPALPTDPRGAALFQSSGCALCHVPRLGNAPEAPAAFSDFLLHDMGPGLADDRPQGAASGQEWRTAPLWGMSRLGPDGHPAFLLHDGRARSPLEAILWHDGEARQARDHVVAMPPEDRAALIRYLESL